MNLENKNINKCIFCDKKQEQENVFWYVGTKTICQNCKQKIVNVLENKEIKDKIFKEIED